MQDQPQNQKVGRPSKYRLEYCNLLIEHMVGGLSYESFAGLVNVNIDTLYQWEKDHSEFSEAKKMAEPKGRLFWERIGKRMALGLPTKFKDPETNEEIVTANYNTTAWIFIMKNRFRWRDRFDMTTDDRQIGKEPIRVILNQPL